MLFADDTQLYITGKNYRDVKVDVESCIAEIREWMHANLLVLNDSKTELIHFQSIFKDQQKIDSVRIGDSEIIPSHCVRNLGVYFDDKGLMKDNVKQICKAASFRLWRIDRIRHLLDQNLTERLVHAFITSRIDYCNSLLHGLNKCALKPIQTIQNSAARLVTRSSRSQHITPILHTLH